MNDYDRLGIAVLHVEAIRRHLSEDADLKLRYRFWVRFFLFLMNVLLALLLWRVW